MSSFFRTGSSLPAARLEPHQRHQLYHHDLRHGDGRRLGEARPALHLRCEQFDRCAAQSDRFNYDCLSATASTFTANTGFSGNGTSATINVTGYNFNAGTVYAQNSASIFAWSTEAVPDNGYIFGNSSAFNVNDMIQSFNFGSATAAGVNSATNINSGTLATGIGLFTTIRTSSVQIDQYQNTTNIATSGSNTSAAVVSSNPWFLGLASAGFFGGNSRRAASAAA
ncbi:MAG: hypothetical protein P4M05_22735 [Bradyrhizobium sp.]|nr:hypothetical protein [Bradyrhizobium sp.]